MKKYLVFIFSFLFICFAAKSAFAGAAIDSLVNNIDTMNRRIHEGSSKLMMYADMLRCNSLHGKGANFHFSILDIVDIYLQLIEPFTFISSLILYILGFCIMMVASFYMFDVAFHISVAIVILPLGLALYPFGWTKEKLKQVIEMILYYTGVFIFLPLGIHLGVAIVEQVMTHGFSGDGSFNFEKAFAEDDSEAIKDHLSIISWGFWGVLLCYLVAIRLIPLMADEFCTHFFGQSLIGNPMSDKITSAIKVIKSKTVDKAKQYTKDSIQHKRGKKIENKHQGKTGFVDRALARYGKDMADTRNGNNNRI